MESEDVISLVYMYSTFKVQAVEDAKVRVLVHVPDPRMQVESLVG